jgi:hypothetical protein
LTDAVIINFAFGLRRRAVLLAYRFVGAFHVERLLAMSAGRSGHPQDVTPRPAAFAPER